MWPLILSGVGAVHFYGVRVLGKSRFYAGNALYYQGKRYVGKTVRNSFAQPNHYDRNGQIVGYTRKLRRTKAVHSDGKYGKLIGWIRCLLIIWLHKSKKGGYFHV